MEIAFLKIDNDPMFHFGIAAVRATLAETEHSAHILDGTFIPPRKKKEMILAQIERISPDIVGLSVSDHDYLESLDYARAIKAMDQEVHIVFGGPMPTLIPKEILGRPEVDSICMGDGELFPEFLSFLDWKKSTPPTGFVAKGKDGKHIGRLKAHMHRNLDSLPFVDLKEWDMDLYKRFYQLPEVLPLIASRGCPYKCKYCSAGSLRRRTGKGPRAYHRHRSPESVIEEIAFNLERFPKAFKHISFEDAIFGSDRGWFRRFAELYRDRGYHEELQWTCETRADLITDEWVQTARSAGCAHLRMGVETWDEEYRSSVYAKYIPNRTFRDAARRLHREGIYFNANMIVGGPDEGLGEVFRNFKGILGLDPLFVTFHPFRLTPGTEMCEALGQRATYQNGLPRFSGAKMSAVFTDRLINSVLSGLQRVRCLGKAMGSPRILMGGADYLLNLHGKRSEPLIGGRRTMHTTSLQQILLGGLIRGKR